MVSRARGLLFLPKSAAAAVTTQLYLACVGAFNRVENSRCLFIFIGYCIKARLVLKSCRVFLQNKNPKPRPFSGKFVMKSINLNCGMEYAKESLSILITRALLSRSHWSGFDQEAYYRSIYYYHYVEGGRGVSAWFSVLPESRRFLAMMPV